MFKNKKKKLTGIYKEKFSHLHWLIHCICLLYEIQQEVEEARMKQEEATAALLAASSTPQHHHVAEQEDTEENDDIPNGDISKDLYIGDEPIEDPVEERRTLAERNERLQNQLKVLWKHYEIV